MWYNGVCAEPTFWSRLCAYTHWTYHLWLRSLPFSFLAALVMTAYACVYKNKIVEEIPQEMISKADADADDLKSWKEREVGLFEVFKFPSQCLWAFCCTPVVAGKNYHTTAVMPFWPACISVFVAMVSCFWPLYCIMAIGRTVLAGNLQRNMGYQPNFVVNCCLTLFCFPCEIGRESIEVNEALGVTIECPFTVTRGIRANVEMLMEGGDRSCTRVCS